VVWRLVAGAAAILVSAVAVPSSGQAAVRCTDAAARSAIRYAKPHFAALGPPQTFPATAADRLVCFDATGDGMTDMAVSLFSGGTAGDVGWVFFAAKPDGWQYAGHGSGYKLGLRRMGARLEVIQPVYRTNDPNCCPTGGFDRTLYGWNGRRLAAVRSWHTKTASR
jgi:hypothetical protein